MMNIKPKNIAGEMGRRSSQPAKNMISETVDPIERLNQKIAGRMEGGSKSKKRKSLMNSYGMM
jgi:hypothetical protein